MLTVDALRELGADNFRVLLTMVAPRPSKDAEEARALLDEAKVPMFTPVIHRLIAFARAALAGTTVDKSGDPRGAVGWREYAAVGEEILTILKVKGEA